MMGVRARREGKKFNISLGMSQENENAALKRWGVSCISCQFMVITTTAICIPYLLNMDGDVQHLEILVPAAFRFIPRRSLKPFISLAGSAPVIFSNQLELVPPLSHVLRGLVGHLLSCIRPRLFSLQYVLKQAYFSHRQCEAATTDGK